MVYTCSDAIDDITAVVMKKMCPVCPNKAYCWCDNEPDLEKLVECVSGNVCNKMKKMDDATAKALEGSIRKWERIRDGTGKDMGVANCPLCQMFYLNHECVGCPVFERTGRRLCAETPYEDFYDNAPEEVRIAGAEREIEFLKSLRTGAEESDEAARRDEST
ncbi:MAG: hypothetical protein M0R06_00855 [Sphaerochaeta sp.]|jgi:hypothetical protein|nr:hypothetical protein [Sphaerochaeta sp.]